MLSFNYLSENGKLFVDYWNATTHNNSQNLVLLSFACKIIFTWSVMSNTKTHTLSLICKWNSNHFNKVWGSVIFYCFSSRQKYNFWECMCERASERVNKLNRTCKVDSTIWLITWISKLIINIYIPFIFVRYIRFVLYLPRHSLHFIDIVFLNFNSFRLQFQLHTHKHTCTTINNGRF